MNAKRALATIQIGADSKRLESGLNEARRRMRAFQSFAKKALDVGKSVGSGITAGLGMQIGGGVTGMLTEATAKALDMSEALTRFQIDAKLTDTELADIRGSLDRTSKKFGLHAAEIVKGSRSYVDLTSDARNAAKVQEMLAKVATATGASLEDAAAGTAAFKEAGVVLADYEAAWSGLVNQAQQGGSVGLKEMGAELASILPMMQQFSGGGLEAVINTGAALQVIRKGTGSAAEAANRLSNLIGAIGKSAPKLRKVGIEIFKTDASGKRTKDLRAFRDIIGEIADKGYTIETLGSVLGDDAQSKQAMNLLAKYMKDYDGLLQMGRDRTVIEKDAASFMASQAGEAKKMRQEWEQMKAAVAEEAITRAVQVGKFVGSGGQVEMGDAGGVVRETLGMKPQEKLLFDEAAKRSAKILPAIMQGGSGVPGLQGQNALAFERQAELLSKAAGKFAAEATRTGDPTLQFRIEALALQNAAKFLSDTAKSMTVGGVGGMLRHYAERGAAAAVVVKMDASTVAKSVDNSPAARAPKGR